MVSGCADGGVKVWDGATGQCLGALEGGHVGGVNALLVRSMSHVWIDSISLTSSSATGIGSVLMPSASSRSIGSPKESIGQVKGAPVCRDDDAIHLLLLLVLSLLFYLFSIRVILA